MRRVRVVVLPLVHTRTDDAVLLSAAVPGVAGLALTLLVASLSGEAGGVIILAILFDQRS